MHIHASKKCSSKTIPSLIVWFSRGFSKEFSTRPKWIKYAFSFFQDVFGLYHSWYSNVGDSNSEIINIFGFGFFQFSFFSLHLYNKFYFILSIRLKTLWVTIISTAKIVTFLSVKNNHYLKLININSESSYLTRNRFKLQTKLKTDFFPLE